MKIANFEKCFAPMSKFGAYFERTFVAKAKISYGFQIPNETIFSEKCNRPFSYSTKEPGSSVIFIHFYT